MTLSLVCLCGTFRHWLFWQDHINLCNRSNPAGDVTSRITFHRLNVLCIVLGVASTIRRYWMAYYLARRLHARYNESVCRLVDKLTILMEVSELALVPRPRCDETMAILPKQSDGVGMHTTSGIAMQSPRPIRHAASMRSSISENDSSKIPGLDVISQGTEARLFPYLDDWDEPPSVNKLDTVSLNTSCVSHSDCSVSNSSVF